MANTDEGRLVEAARAGDQQAFGQLFDQWFDRVHDLSRRIVHDDGIAGEVAQDAFLKAWTKLDVLDDADAFGGWLLRIARNASLNRLEKERRAVNVDDETLTAVTDARAPEHDPLARMDQAARIDLVWDAAAALGPRDASVLDLHLRHGLTPAELAEELGCTPNNAHQVLFTMRKRLATSVRALVLWRAGRPTCPDLRQSLTAAGLTSFGAPMVKAIDSHAGACDLCSGERDDRLSPAALFAAAPIVVAGTLIKANAAAGLAAEGVPMAGSSAAGGGTASTATSTIGSAGGSGSSTAGRPVDALTTSAGAPTSAIPTDPPVGAVSGDESSPSNEDARDPRYARRALVLAVLALLVVAGVVLAFRPDRDTVELTTATSTPGAAATTTTTPTTAANVPTASVAPPPTTIPTFDVPAAPEPTPPGPAGPVATTAPRPVAPPPPTSPPTVTATSSPSVPVINSFNATATTQTCGAVGAAPFVVWNLAWTTTGADGVTVGPSSGARQPAPADGATSVCAPAPPNGQFVLTATGPGGQTSAAR